jgi:hypothetical protein
MFKTFFALGAARLATGLAFAGPSATLSTGFGLSRGWTPTPTQDPLALFKRERASSDVCGWYEDGFSTQQITCPTGACMAYTKGSGMIGCCTSTAGGYDYQDCGYVNNCYDYSDVQAGRCDNDCEDNPLNRVCSVSSLPFCLSFTCE